MLKISCVGTQRPKNTEKLLYNLILCYLCMQIELT